MTRINDYVWQLPHDPEPDDPLEIATVITEFIQPIVQTLTEPMATHGYNLSTSDVLVNLDNQFDEVRTRDTYLANIRFIKYIQPTILTRVHFQHASWALFLPNPERHQYYVNLDRFKVVDTTQQVVPAWEGRLSSRLASQSDDILHAQLADEKWAYASPGELDQQLALFLEKFARLILPWLEVLGAAN